MIMIIAFVLGFVLLMVGGSAIDSMNYIVPIIMCVIGVALMAPVVVYSRRFEK